ncbi:hypothetical protein F66182_3648 [Fusarium sp. NRRL 66182]|nr:hypothetical protein F66182_3648 [Fusarium sp. NRRL 66182]
MKGKVAEYLAFGCHTFGKTAWNIHVVGLREQHIVPSLEPQRDNEPDTRCPHDAADPRQPTVGLKPHVGDVVRDAARDVAEAQGVERGRRYACMVCGCYPGAVDAKRFNPVFCSGFCS